MVKLKPDGAIRAAVYARVSTQDQARDGVSMDEQVKRCRAYASARGWKVAQVLRDGGASGKDLDRPGARRLLELVESKAVQAVVVFKLDRLTRSLRDLDHLVKATESAGVALASVTETFDTSTASGRAFVNLIGVFAQWMREELVERVTSAIRHKKSEGLVYGSTPLGFRRDGDRLMSDPAEMKTVRRIFDERTAGRTLRVIAGNLLVDGVPTKRGGRWEAMTVRQVLRNDIYARSWKGHGRNPFVRPEG